MIFGEEGKDLFNIGYPLAFPRGNEFPNRRFVDPNGMPDLNGSQFPGSKQSVNRGQGDLQPLGNFSPRQQRILLLPKRGGGKFL
jgi:hypothetical protein